MAAKKSSASDKAQHSAYKTQSRYSKNKKARIERHLKKHPHDVRAAEALKNVPSQPTRKISGDKKWSSITKMVAQLWRKVGENGNRVFTPKEDPYKKAQA